MFVHLLLIFSVMFRSVVNSHIQIYHGLGPDGVKRLSNRFLAYQINVTCRRLRCSSQYQLVNSLNLSTVGASHDYSISLIQHIVSVSITEKRCLLFLVVGQSNYMIEGCSANDTALHFCFESFVITLIEEDYIQEVSWNVMAYMQVARYMRRQKYYAECVDGA